MPNGLAVQIIYRNQRAQGEVRLSDAWRVKPSDTLLAELRAAFGESAVEIAY
ncbi:DNA polymerase III alpha subunit [Burkholderia singularis]|uniref:DNA polymerase III alpha subunit n=1 Tax=Burkholderia singularis TaxID=1503053 RepID=A0A238H804_9BURK|nr:DNA polymerase III alpha subunit [Burkholderia singularis]